MLAAGVLLAACGGRSAPVAPAAPASPPVSVELALQTFDSAWSRIASSHYDTVFVRTRWAEVREEARPRAAAASTLGQLRGVLAAMLEQVGQSHFALIPREAADALGDAAEAAQHDAGDAGMQVRLVEGELLVSRVSPHGAAARAGVRPGWVLTGIAGAPAIPGLERVLALPEAERRLASVRLLYQVNSMFEGGVGDTLRIALLDEAGRPREMGIPLHASSGAMVRFGNLPPIRAAVEHDTLPLRDGAGCIGVIRMNVWMVPIMPEFDRAVDALRGCAGMVLDLRGNPGGVAGMIVGTSGHFLGDTVALGIMRTRTSEVSFRANPRRVSPAGEPVEPFAGAVAIIIDEMSASTTEIFAAGLQGVGRARVFGSRSAGQALPAAMVRLPTSDVLMHVVADFTGPGGVRIEGDGVTPDVAVAHTRRELLAGRDMPLQAALEWIREQNGNGTENRP
jgi:carboxyl-terminal processing protease